MFLPRSRQRMRGWACAYWLAYFASVVVTVSGDAQPEGVSDGDPESQHDGPAEVSTDKHRYLGPVAHLAVVACGERFAETMVMVKSAILVTGDDIPMHFHVFADDNLHSQFNSAFSDILSKDLSSTITYNIYPITFPSYAQWRNVFKPCATQRIFLPDLLNNVPRLLYVDTDVLFLVSLAKVWSFWDKLNATQLAVLAPEHESPNAGWYNRFARHPYYGKLGVNTGVMLMDLDRMRGVSWSKAMIPIYAKYSKNITWGDQDLINIYFHDFPERLYVFSCEWNYRPDHCMYMPNCPTAETGGVKVLHGSRGYFHLPDKQPAFVTVYGAFEKLELGVGTVSDLVQQIRDGLRTVPAGGCGHPEVKKHLIKALKKLVK